MGRTYHAGVAHLVPAGYLIDENLSPRLRLGFPEGTPVIHATEVGVQPSDTDLWTLARERRWVIITKDADFRDRAMLLETPLPWVIQLCCGNLRASALRALLEDQWPKVAALLPAHRLVRVFPDHLEATA